MELAILFAGLMVASALGYVGLQVKAANAIAIVRVEFEMWNASWPDDRKKEFENHVSSVFKKLN